MARFPSAPRTPWIDSFPDIVAHAEYRDMREHPAYRAAKDGVSSEAALALVYDLLSDSAVDQIRAQLKDHAPRVVGVHAEEATGRNKIPLAYAEALAYLLDLDTDPGIVQSSVANHGGAESVYHRMVSQPTFDGYVEAEASYVIVDDTCTLGGTLANLKGFIETNGGTVLCVSTLARRGSSSPGFISLAPTTLARLNRKHRGIDEFWREEFGYGIECLTEGEAGHLLAAPTLGTIRNRLAEARRDLNIIGNEIADRPEGPAAATDAEQTGESAARDGG